MRNRSLVLVPFLVLLFVSVLSLSAQTLRIYHIDVDQGDATLLVAPNGNTLLVDSGRNRQGSRLKRAMDQAGVSRIDFFVDTHYHADHYGGIDDLVNLGIQVVESYDRADKIADVLPSGKLDEPTFVDYETAVGQDATHIRPGDTIPLDPSIMVTCISSGGVVIGEANPSTGRDENDMSVSLLIAFGDFTYFVGGDIGQPTEAKIAERDLVVDVDVYQANHHGSDTSSSRAFMEDLEPRVIVISNGNRRDYKHPKQSTLNLYASLPGPPTVFQTNKYTKGGDGGNVPDTFIADLDAPGDEGTIILNVDGGAGTYTVTYRDVTPQTFQIKGESSSVVIASLLPNPPGNDRLNEEVTLRNSGSTAINLAGWTLEDRSGKSWSLTDLGTLAAGESKTIRRDEIVFRRKGNDNPF